MLSRQELFDPLLDTASFQPKYEQIVELTREAIRSGRLKVGDPLPSINAMSNRYKMARETVRKSYETLRRMGLVTSRQGKSYSIASQRTDATLNVFVLFDVFANAYKETVYEALRQRLGPTAVLDCYTHHFQPQLFASLLREARGKYHHHVVIPIAHPEAARALAEMDQEKLLLLDIRVDFPGKSCLQVSQSHDEHLFQALEVGLDRIRRYGRFVLVFPSPDHHHPSVIRDAFTRFCEQHQIEGEIISQATLDTAKKGSAYLVIEDNDLVALVKGSMARKLVLGRDIGIISYNETPLKEIVAGGVTVVSVDFRELGLRAAETILGLNRQSICLPTRFIQRATL
jgi:DNA-binding transcriptional regulator YhcF (GntR family)